MPVYLFSNPNNPEEIIEVVMSVNDVHEYVKDGLKWDRIFTIPNAAVDTQLDPFNSNDFVKKTGKGSDTYGALLDRSQEMSIKRQDKLGYDPVKEKMFADYSKKRKGTEHPLKRKERLAKLQSEGISLKLKK